MYWSQMRFAWLPSGVCVNVTWRCAKEWLRIFLCGDAGSAQDDEGIGSGVVLRAPAFPVKFVSDVEM